MFDTAPKIYAGETWTMLPWDKYLIIEEACRAFRSARVAQVAVALTGSEKALFILRNDPADVLLGDVNVYLSTYQGAFRALALSLEASGVAAADIPARLTKLNMVRANQLARWAIGFDVPEWETNPLVAADGKTDTTSSATSTTPTPAA